MPQRPSPNPFAPPSEREDLVDLERRRDQLRARVAELQWDLGGLVFEMATRDHIRKVESLRAWNARVEDLSSMRNQVPGLLGRVALIAVLLFGFLGYLKIHHRSVYDDTSMLLLIGILTAVVMGVGWVVVNQIGGYEMLIPVTVLSLTIAVVFGQELAFVATLVASLLVAVVYGLGLPFLTGSALAGIATILAK